MASQADTTDTAMVDDVTRRKTINSSYTTVEKKSQTNTKRVVDVDSGSEQYSMDDLQVTKLNNADVISIDSALISAEEQDLAESSTDVRQSGRYQQRPPSGFESRRVSDIRRQSAINVTRRMSMFPGADARVGPMDDNSRSGYDRRISIVGSDRDSISTPGGVRRNVSAFGEITVMPVGERSEQRPRVAVDEEFVG